LKGDTPSQIQLQISIVSVSEVRGKSVEEFMSANQDRARSALQKSVEAAYNAWVEQLKTDQTQFESEKILPLDPILKGLHPHSFNCSGYLLATLTLSLSLPLSLRIYDI
jgi:hypothetical protein